MAQIARIKVGADIYELRDNVIRGEHTEEKATSISREPPPAAILKQRSELGLYEWFERARGKCSLSIDAEKPTSDTIRILDVSSDGAITSQSLDISEERDAQSVGAKLSEITPNLATRLIINSTQREEPTPKDIFAQALFQTFAVEPSMLCIPLWRRHESLSGFKDPFSPLKPTFVDFEDGQCAKIITGIALTPTHGENYTIGSSLLHLTNSGLHVLSYDILSFYHLFMHGAPPVLLPHKLPM